MRTAPAPRRKARKHPVRRPLGHPGKRLRIGLVIVVVLMLALGGRLLQLQGLQSAAYADDATSQRSHTIPLLAERGQVLDRNGRPLAMSVAAKAVYGEPKTIRTECARRAQVAAETTSKTGSAPVGSQQCSPASIAAVIAPLLGLQVADVAAKLAPADQKKNFVYLARALDPAVATTVSTEVAKLELPGVGTSSETRRVHPDGDLASTVLGYDDVDGKGVAGIESTMQSTLAGKDGLLSAQTDTSGRIIPTGTGTDRQPVAGRDVTLTIDSDLQWEAQQKVSEAVAATEAENGTAITMNVQTGQVLAMATAPTFRLDDKHATTGGLRNFAISDVYEPGSVNKVITAAAALTAGIVTPTSPITVPPVLPLTRSHSVHDAENHGTEHLTFAGVLAKSSNIGTVEVAQKVGPQRLYDMLTAFGFGSKTHVGLPGESRGIVPQPADWSDTSIGTIPIGQGISVTALQVASVYATIANGGVRVSPTIVAGTEDAAGHFVAAPAPESHRVISAHVSAQIRQMLEGVVSAEGTAPQAAIPGYRVAGKTGTAQRVVDGKYAPHNYTSSFAGFAPADAPKIVTVVVLQGTGKKGYFGGSVSAPVFSSVTAFALRENDVPPTGTTPVPFPLCVSPTDPLCRR